MFSCTGFSGIMVIWFMLEPNIPEEPEYVEKNINTISRPGTLTFKVKIIP